jgi:hypothetical protein
MRGDHDLNELLRHLQVAEACARTYWSENGRVVGPRVMTRAMVRSRGLDVEQAPPPNRGSPPGKRDHRLLLRWKLSLGTVTSQSRARILGLARASHEKPISRRSDCRKIDLAGDCTTVFWLLNRRQQVW